MRKWGEKKEKRGGEREANQDTDSTPESERMVSRGEVGAGLGIQEGMCDEQWAWSGSVPSGYCTPEANVMLYVNSLKVN